MRIVRAPRQLATGFDTSLTRGENRARAKGPARRRRHSMSGMVRLHPAWSALALVAFAGGGACSGGGAAGVDAGGIDAGHDVVSGGGADARGRGVGAIPTGAATMLASGQTDVGGIAVSGGNAIWTTCTMGTLASLA